MQGTADLARTALVAATALHTGFQLVVTLLVYPAFADVPEAGWQAHHARHSRRIAPLVIVVYCGLLAAGAAVLVTGPSPAEVAVLAAVAVAPVLTAAVAAPAHVRLARGPDPATLRRLLVADRLRCVAAVLAAVLALAA